MADRPACQVRRPVWGAQADREETSTLAGTLSLRQGWTFSSKRPVQTVIASQSRLAVSDTPARSARRIHLAQSKRPARVLAAAWDLRVLPGRSIRRWPNEQPGPWFLFVCDGERRPGRSEGQRRRESGQGCPRSTPRLAGWPQGATVAVLGQPGTARQPLSGLAVVHAGQGRKTCPEGPGPGRAAAPLGSQAAATRRCRDDALRPQAHLIFRRR